MKAPFSNGATERISIARALGRSALRVLLPVLLAEAEEAGCRAGLVRTAYPTLNPKGRNCGYATPACLSRGFASASAARESLPAGLRKKKYCDSRMTQLLASSSALFRVKKSACDVEDSQASRRATNARSALVFNGRYKFLRDWENPNG